MVIVNVFASSCGYLHIDIDNEVHPDYYPYIAEYKELKQRYLGTSDIKYNISYVFEELPGSRVGECRSRGNQRTVVVDPRFWQLGGDNISDFRYCLRKMVFLHEMGHCDLDRGHTDDPDSLMQTYITSFDFCQNETSYLEELFLQ